MIVIRIVIFILGLAIVVKTLSSAIRTLILPRSAPDLIAGVVFVGVRRLFLWRLHWIDGYLGRDRVMALYAPVAVFMLLPWWLSLVMIGYMAMFWAAGTYPMQNAFLVSGSSLFTLGFASVPGLLHTLLEFSEATIGLILVALLIAYMPTMYNAFSRREAAVSQLASRAGNPPSALEMIMRVHRIGELQNLRDFWELWETLFSEIEESHTSLTALVFFRSPNPTLSWVTAAGAVLDTAALIASTVDTPRQPRAELCLRAGFLALRHIAAYFDLDQPDDPHFPQDPISITRAEYDAVWQDLEASGVPLKADRERSWQDFAGWRVNYDRSLVALCALTMAPYALWSSDRAADMPVPRLRLFRRQR